MSNTASHDHHENINSWVSFSFLYEYGVLLGGPLGRQSSAVSDKLLRTLSSSRWIHDTANTRSEIVIVYKLLPLGEHKVQGVVLIPESVDIDLVEMGVPPT